MDWIKEPWPWYIGGPLIGLIGPVLLIVANKSLGVSASFKHLCAMCIPVKPKFFDYNWRAELWNIVFAGGMLLGGAITYLYLSKSGDIQLSEAAKETLHNYGINTFSGLVPQDIFSFSAITDTKGIFLMIIGGFFVGFGTRYAGGCTSGHTIAGLSNLQWPSLIATICFFIGGLVSTHFILPLILK